MDQYVFFAVAAVLLAAFRYGTYFYTIHKGETKPHAFTWFLWGAVVGVGAFAQLQLNAGPSAWALVFVSATCLLIAFLALFIGVKDYQKSDWIALFLCLIAIPVWKITQNPLTAIFIIVFIDLLTYWPTIRKSYLRPDAEPPISSFFAGLRYFLLLFAVPEPTWQNLLYPFFLMLADWGFALYIMVRRYQMGYPLHEYSKKISA